MSDEKLPKAMVKMGVVNGGDGYAAIYITDERSGAHIGLKLSLEDYARLISGSIISAEVHREDDVEKWGMLREIRVAKFSVGSVYGENRQKLVKENIELLKPEGFDYRSHSFTNRGTCDIRYVKWTPA